jgi:adenylate cyclase
MAKVYGAGILVDHNTKDMIKDSYHIRELDVVNKHHHHGLALYEIMACTNSEPNHDMMTTIISYELGLAEYRSKNWQAAIMHFKKSQTLTDDHPSKYMIERCRCLIDGRLELKDDWDESWDL